MSAEHWWVCGRYRSSRIVDSTSVFSIAHLLSSKKYNAESILLNCDYTCSAMWYEGSSNTLRGPCIITSKMEVEQLLWHFWRNLPVSKSCVHFAFMLPYIGTSTETQKSFESACRNKLSFVVPLSHHRGNHGAVSHLARKGHEETKWRWDCWNWGVKSWF